jgi:predicted glutamine amidotransferase
MCIAILNNTETLTLETIKNSFENNRDGASFTYIENDIIKTYKEMDLNKVDIFYTNYAKVREANKLPMMLHFRIGTSGIKDKRNLHPFFINKNLALVHNGIIDIPNINPDYSDTYHFAKLCRQFKSHDKFLNIQSLEFKSLQDLIGSSKIIYLSNKGTYSIMNESLGHWDKNNNWFSNKTYEACNYYDFGGIKTYKHNNYKYNEFNFFSNDKPSKTSAYSFESKFENCVYNDNFHVREFSWFMDLSYSQKCEQLKQVTKIPLNTSIACINSELNKLHEYYGTKNLYDLYIEVCYDIGLIDYTKQESLLYESKT